MSDSFGPHPSDNPSLGAGQVGRFGFTTLLPPHGIGRRLEASN